MFKKIRDQYRLNKAQKIERKRAIEQAKNDPSRFDQSAFAWAAPLRRKMQKGTLWVVMTSLAVAVLLFYGSATGNWIFVAAVILAVIAYTADHFEKNGQIEIKISDFGIKVGSHGIPFSNIRAFWIVYDPPYVQMLHIRTFDRTIPDIGIDLDAQDPVALRKFLTRHITELEGKKESLMDISTRLLKL